MEEYINNANKNLLDIIKSFEKKIENNNLNLQLSYN